MDGAETIEQTKEENEISDSKEASQEKKKNFLPKIADLPEKAQKRAFKKLEEARQINQETQRLLGRAEQDVVVYKSKEPEFSLIADSCEKITPEQQAEQDRKTQVVKRQFDILASAFAKVSHGQDAPELMELSPDFFDESELHSLFTPQEVQQYKKRSKIARSLQRLKMKFSSK